jgi:PEP-CTERM motif
LGKFVNASRTYSLIGLLLASAATLGWSTPVAAQNYAPPAGAILDLNGLSLPVDSPTLYSATFTGDNGETPLTFLFRDDYANIVFSNVVLVDVTTGSLTNLLVSGNFSGSLSGKVHTSNGNPDTPTGWTFINPNLPASGVFVDGYFATQTKPEPYGQCVVVGNCWADGTTGGYDELSQTVLMKSSDSYRISFDATVTASLPESNTTWSDINTTTGTGFAGNAANILAYIGPVGAFTQAPPPVQSLPGGGEPIPEPSTWAMMLLGFAGLAFIGYRRAPALAS